MKITSPTDVNKLEGLPKLVYKYRDWKIQDHRRWVEVPEIYFASPLEFGTKHEEFWKVNFKMLDELSDITEIGIIYANKYIETLKTPIISELPAIRAFMANRVSEILNNPREREKYQKVINNLWNRETSILCLSKSPKLYRMWNDRFTGFGNGICIGYDTKSLGKHLWNDSIGEEINYYEEGNEPQVTPFNLDKQLSFFEWKKQLNSLPKELFEHEEEYRVARLRRSVDTSIESKKNLSISENFRGRVEIDKSIIKEVIIDSRIPKNDFNDILELENGLNTQISIKKANMDKTWKRVLISTIN